MAAADEVEFEELVGEHAAAYRRHADAAVLDPEIVDHLGEAVVYLAVLAARAVSELRFGQRVRSLVNHLESFLRGGHLFAQFGSCVTHHFLA